MLHCHHHPKKDKETNKNIPQGDATLEHAVYGLYARNDILHPDKKTGVLYKAGEQVGTLAKVWEKDTFASRSLV